MLTGEFSNRGVGVTSCSNGWNLNPEIPADSYGTPNGSYVEPVDGTGSAVGWGSDADPEWLLGSM